MRFTLLLLLTLCLGVITPAWAEVSRDQAAAIATQASAGRVLSIERVERDGQTLWRVKLLTSQGEVRVVWIDAASGRIR